MPPTFGGDDDVVVLVVAAAAAAAVAAAVAFSDEATRDGSGIVETMAWLVASIAIVFPLPLAIGLTGHAPFFCAHHDSYKINRLLKPDRSFFSKIKSKLTSWCAIFMNICGNGAVTDPLVQGGAVSTG